MEEAKGTEKWRGSVTSNAEYLDDVKVFVRIPTLLARREGELHKMAPIMM
jgi:hypothetical protein